MMTVEEQIAKDNNVNNEFKTGILSESEKKERMALKGKLMEYFDEVNELYQKVTRLRSKQAGFEWRNTDIYFWERICEHFKESDLLNCYGDIFFITDRDGEYYLGRRVLWNFRLSEELYEIHETMDDYDVVDYEIKLSEG